MEKRSRRRIRDLVALAAFQGLSQNEIGCARISMMTRSTNAPFKGRIQKRKTNHLQIITFGLQRTAGPTSEVDLSLDYLVGEREKRRGDREAGRRSLRRPRGLASGLAPPFPALHEPNKSCLALWGGLNWLSFWCGGLVRERLDRRRTANLDVAAAIASG